MEISVDVLVYFSIYEGVPCALLPPWELFFRGLRLSGNSSLSVAAEVFSRRHSTWWLRFVSHTRLSYSVYDKTLFYDLIITYFYCTPALRFQSSKACRHCVVCFHVVVWTGVIKLITSRPDDGISTCTTPQLLFECPSGEFYQVDLEACPTEEILLIGDPKKVYGEQWYFTFTSEAFETQLKMQTAGAEEEKARLEAEAEVRNIEETLKSRHKRCVDTCSLSGCTRGTPWNPQCVR